MLKCTCEKVTRLTLIQITLTFDHRQVRHFLSERNNLVELKWSLSHVECKCIQFFKPSDKLTDKLTLTFVNICDRRVYI